MSDNSNLSKEKNHSDYVADEEAWREAINSTPSSTLLAEIHARDIIVNGKWKPAPEKGEDMVSCTVVGSVDKHVQRTTMFDAMDTLIRHDHGFEMDQSYSNDVQIFYMNKGELAKLRQNIASQHDVTMQSRRGRR